MTSAMPFARELAASSAKYLDTANAWANNKECDFIDTDNTSEFFRVWLACVLYGAISLTVIIVPYFLCSGRPSKSFDDPKTLVPKVDREEEKAISKHFASKVTTHFSESWKMLQEAKTKDISAEVDFQKAEEHLRATSPLDRDTDPRGKWRPIWSTKVSEMSEIGGIGLELYFRLLRILGFTFGCKTIFSLPVLAFALYGDFVPDLGNSFAKTTIGNLGSLMPQGQADRLVILGCQGVSLSKLTPYFGWLDFAGTCMFTMFVIYFRFVFVPRASKIDDRENVTCRDFSVQIDCLPSQIPDQKSYEKQLAEHLMERIRVARQADKHGPKTQTEPGIAEVTLVRDFDERLGTVKYRNELLEEQRIERERRRADGSVDADEAVFKATCCGCRKRSIESIVAAQDYKLKNALRPTNELDVLRAFVICRCPDDRVRLLMHYRFSRYRLFRCCQSSDLRFCGKAIEVKRAPEPSNLIWENQDVPWRKRLLMQGIIFLVWVVVIVFAILLIFAVQKAAAEAGGKAGVQHVGEDVCDAGTRPAPKGESCLATEAALWTTSHARNFSSVGNTSAVSCFCTTQGYSTIVQDKTLWNDICKDWLVDAASRIGLTSLSSIVTVIVNAVLLALIHWMVVQERHGSVSSLNSSLMFKITWSQWFNISLIVFLIHYRSDPLEFIFNGDYSDFERGWYAVVGSTLVMNMVLNAVTNPILNILFWLIAVVQRCSCCTRKVKHQVDLRRLYTNPEFDISARYAGILVTVLGTLTYSAGLPILNFFAALFFFLTFWSDKVVLLWGSKTPPQFDIQMPKACTEYMLIALPIHVFVSMAMFSHACTFPSDPLGGQLGGLADQAGSAAPNLSYDEMSIKERISREASWMFFVLGVLLLALWTFWLLMTIFGATFGTVWKACVEICCPRRVQTLPESHEEFSWDRAGPHIERIHPPASYRMERIRGLEDLAHLFSTLDDDAEGRKALEGLRDAARADDPVKTESVTHVTEIGGDTPGDMPGDTPS